MDFVHDQLATGHKVRVLTTVDIFSRFSPALEPRFTFRGTDVVEVLEKVCNEVGFPATILSIKAASSCRAISMSGRTSAASRWTSHVRENQLTMPPSKPSTAVSRPNASMLIWFLSLADARNNGRHTRSGLLQPAASPLGADVPLINAEMLFSNRDQLYHPWTRCAADRQR
jgi:hypothetical protein